MAIQTNITPIRWEDDYLLILDQRALPTMETYLNCCCVEEVADAIRTLAVRGAPLIGITAAYGMVIAAAEATDRKELLTFADYLAATRPTAVNLFWALDRCRSIICHAAESATMTDIYARLLTEAQAIHAEDAAACAAMAACGASLFPFSARVLTHCNAGALATGGIGTALGVIRAAHTLGRVHVVWVDETRPLLQGARLTAWELDRDGIPFRVQCDNMAAALMQAGEVDLVIVGADRITRAGDFANKIGTYGLAVLAQAHGIPFYVAAPWSTIDLSLVNGTLIPVEHRLEEEVSCIAGNRITPAGAPVWNPAFDVTPGKLVTAFITERGILQPPFSDSELTIAR